VESIIADLLNIGFPLTGTLAAAHPNCFNAVQRVLSDSEEITFLGPEEFVKYIQEKSRQFPIGTDRKSGDISVIWSRSSNVLKIGEIRIEELRKDRDGYPFGLIIEHAFIYMDSHRIFQKRDRTAEGPYEILEAEQAIEPYRSRAGLEITLHRKE